jgi:uncharacterized circularly permuted ATP-grasp superfamily protein
MVDAGAGLVQRAELLDLILTDLYGPRLLLERRLLPPEAVYGHAGFLREVDQIRLPAPRQLFLSACDLVRDDGGRWTVLSDRTQAPSGAGYAMENRRVVSRTMAGIHHDAAIRRIGPFFHASRLRRARSPTSRPAPRMRIYLSSRIFRVRSRHYSRLCSPSPALRPRAWFATSAGIRWTRAGGSNARSRSSN